MKQIITKACLKRSLSVVIIFNILSAISGGIGLAWNNAIGLPESFLTGTPFKSYFWPGVILGLVVGGTQLLALAALLGKSKLGLFWAAVAGFGMQIWIFGEIYATQMVSWLQIVYFATGTLELILVLGLLGIAPKLVKPESRSIKH